jgi:hypothetical protein
MNSHKHARLTAKGRALLVRRVHTDGCTVNVASTAGLRKPSVRIYRVMTTVADTCPERYATPRRANKRHRMRRCRVSAAVSVTRGATVRSVERVVSDSFGHPPSFRWA